MHLDPDFSQLTYGDQGERGRQIQNKLRTGDLIAFYAGLRAVGRYSKLTYALIGLYVIETLCLARELAKRQPDANAHTRRILNPDADDVVAIGKCGVSGRLRRCVPIGEFRDRAYRVRTDLLHEWGGLSVRNGYIQRSARLPEFVDADRFYRWFQASHAELIQSNN